MKKILAAFVAVALIFGPVGTYVFQDQATHVDARGYKSGIRGFNHNNNFNKNKGSVFQNKKQNSFNNRSSMNKNKRSFMPKGGFMKGMMLGGLAGLLFGGMLGHMGMLGSVFGLLINVMAIFVLISIIGKIITLFKRKKKEENNPWRN